MAATLIVAGVEQSFEPSRNQQQPRQNEMTAGVRLNSN